MKKKIYVKKVLQKNIKTATKEIKKHYKKLKDIHKLPNDCLGIEIGGMISENKDYKIDLISNHYHVIGYFECLKAISKEMLDFIDMNKKSFKKYLENQRKIVKFNNKQMKKLTKLIK